jgi:endoglycosylceramidase
VQGTFELTYETAAAGGGHLPPGLKTQIFVPARQYPSGYDVQVDGAKVVDSDVPNALLLLAKPKAEQVSVRITPKS